MQERGEEVNAAKGPSIKATENVASIDDSFESAKIYSLQLHKEDSPFISDDKEKERIVVEDPSSNRVLRSAILAETEENATFKDKEVIVEEEIHAEDEVRELM